MADVGVVKYKVELDDSDVGKQADKTESTLKSKFGNAAKSVGKAATAALAAGTAAVAGLTTAIVDGTKETASYGDNIDKLSQKIGISAQAFQEWDYIFSQNGADISILETGMKTLSSAVADAGNGTKSAQEKFQQLGLSFEELGKMSQEDMFGAVIEQLQTMPEGAERTALAADLLGKSAMELGPLLNQSATETENLREQAYELGMVMSDEAVKASAGFTDSLDNLQRAFRGAKGAAMDDLLPAMTEITNGLADLVAGNEGASEAIQSGFDSMAESLTSALPNIISIFESLVQSILTVGPKIIETLGDSLVNSIPTLIPKVGEIIMKLVEMLIKKAPDLIKCGLQMITQLAMGLAQALPDLIPAAIDAVLTFIETLLDNLDLLIDTAMQLMMGLAEGLINAIPKLLEKAPIIIEKLISSLLGNIPKLIECAIKLVIGLAGGLIKAIPQLILAIPQIIAAIVKGLIEGIVQIAEVGWDLVKGLWEGIKKGWTWLTDKVTELAKGLIKGVKNFFGISSPSKLFRDEVGKWIPEGMAIGIEENTDAVTDSVNNLVDNTMETVNKSMGIDYNLPDIAGYAADLSAMITASSSTEIIVPLTVDGREIARASAWYMNEQLAWEAR